MASCHLSLPRAQIYARPPFRQRDLHLVFRRRRHDFSRARILARASRSPAARTRLLLSCTRQVSLLFSPGCAGSNRSIAREQIVTVAMEARTCWSPGKVWSQTVALVHCLLGLMPATHRAPGRELIERVAHDAPSIVMCPSRSGLVVALPHACSYGGKVDR
jgi:hypothetical protein